MTEKKISKKIQYFCQLRGSLPDNAARLYLVALNPGPVRAEEIDQRERQHAAEVDDDRQNDGKERRLDGPALSETDGPDGLQQSELTRLCFEQTRGEVDRGRGQDDVEHR